jgi:hypothetical protein
MQILGSENTQTQQEAQH